MANKPSKDIDLKKEIDKSVKMFDVAKPGASAPSPTSRPIIIRHNQVLRKDPMVRDEEAQAEPEADTKAAPLKAHREKIISPDADKPSAEPAPAEPAATAEVEEPVTDSATQETPEKNEEEKTEPKALDTKSEVAKADAEPEKAEAAPKEEGGDKPEAASAAVVDSLAEEVTAKQQKQKDKDAEEAKAAELQKIIESKEFYVKINETGRRRSHHQVVLLMAIIILLSGFNFALDAGLLNLGIEPLTNLL